MAPRRAGEGGQGPWSPRRSPQTPGPVLGLLEGGSLGARGEALPLQKRSTKRTGGPSKKVPKSAAESPESRCYEAEKKASKEICGRVTGKHSLEWE